MNNFELNFLREHLPNQYWRLNNLYHIIDEDGKDVLFKMRPSQEELYREAWFRNILLKARQEGFTTFIDVWGLDNAIFTPNYAFEINAETKPKAADIFNKKIIYPYEHLPEEVKKFCQIINKTKDGTVVFSNGSSIQVDVSARSGTFQMMHISEYGVVSAKSPAKAEEIQTGSIPAVPKDGLVFIESTAKGSAGQFYDMSMTAKKDKDRGIKLSKLDFKFHFFAWWKHKNYVLPSDNIVIPDRLLRYFDELYSKHGIELTEEQQAWYASQEKTLGTKMWSEYPSYPEEAFKVAQDGAYYSRQFEKIYRENRITFVPYETALPVYTSWDLGISDETSIWFFQFLGKEIRVLDYYENNGEGLPHYIAILKEKPYRYGRHFAPHDIEVRELTSGVSRRNTARKLGIEFDMIPTNKDLAGGIENCREMLGYCFFDEQKTEVGVQGLEAYKKEWDEKNGCYRNHPCHDWASHRADSFRTMAQAWKMGKVDGIQAGDTFASGRGIQIRSKGGLKKI